MKKNFDYHSLNVWVGEMVGMAIERQILLGDESMPVETEVEYWRAVEKQLLNLILDVGEVHRLVEAGDLDIDVDAEFDPFFINVSIFFEGDIDEGVKDVIVNDLDYDVDEDGPGTIVYGIYMVSK